MANLKSSKKDIKRTKKRTIRNNSTESAVRTFYKKAKTSMTSNTIDNATCMSAIVDFESKAMKAARKNIISKKAVSRKVSRLVAALKKKVV